MRAKSKIRSFRLGNELDHKLKHVAALVGTEPSTLLREFVKDGTSLIEQDHSIQERLRKRFE